MILSAALASAFAQSASVFWDGYVDRIRSAQEFKCEVRMTTVFEQTAVNWLRVEYQKPDRVRQSYLTPDGWTPVPGGDAPFSPPIDPVWMFWGRLPSPPRARADVWTVAPKGSRLKGETWHLELVCTRLPSGVKAYVSADFDERGLPTRWVRTRGAKPFVTIFELSSVTIVDG